MSAAFKYSLNSNISRYARLPCLLAFWPWRTCACFGPCRQRTIRRSRLRQTVCRLCGRPALPAGPMKHEPSRFLSNAQIAVNLAGAKPVPAVGDQPENRKPFVQADRESSMIVPTLIESWRFGCRALRCQRFCLARKLTRIRCILRLLPGSYERWSKCSTQTWRPSLLLNFRRYTPASRKLTKRFVGFACASLPIHR